MRHESLYVEMPEGGSGPHCLFIHGLLSSRAQWRANLEPLMAVCRPVLVELWGHGRSPAPTDPAAYAVDSYVALFEALRVKLGAERWFLCGQSFGAGLALNYALRHPQRVLGAAFCNSAAVLAKGDPPAGRDPQLLAALVEGGSVETLRELPFHPRFARRLPEALKAEMLADAERLDPRAIGMALRHTVPRLSVAARAAELTMPLLLVNGRLETSFQAIRDGVEELLPGIAVVDLEGGHAVNAQCAEGFNEALADFVNKHGP